MQIEDIKACINNGSIKWTEHCSFRMFQRGIYRKSVEKIIINGTIIEQYPNDFSYPSCLVAGRDKENKIIHVVCGLGDGNLYIITVYYPNEEKWIDEIKRRKK